MYFFCKTGDPVPFGVPVCVLLARFEAYLGRFDIMYVPSTLQSDLLRDHERVTTGPKMYISDCVQGLECWNARFWTVYWPFTVLGHWGTRYRPNYYTFFFFVIYWQVRG